MSTEVSAPTRPHRLLDGWIETGRIATLDDHLHRYGPLRFPARTTLIDAVDAAGLRGRGGAWFPTATKLRTVAGARRPIMLANGCDGEPASDKDHALLTIAPHLVLDGIALAGHAIGAEEAVLCVHRGGRLAGTVRAAAAERSGDPVTVRVAEVPARFVASEESALVNFLNTGDARPTSKPPRPFERGVRGRPTLVDNVETLAHLALLARYGPDWFRGLGTERAPGTMLLTMAGAVTRPGVRELPVGAPLHAALGTAGGVREPLSAVLVGGFGGCWLPLPAAANLPLSPEDFRAADCLLGVGLIVALPTRSCGLAETARMLRYLAGESASQCGPCMFGLPAIAEDFAMLVSGRPGVLDRLRHRLGIVTGRGACAHPDGAARLAGSALRAFAADARAHAAGAPCRWAGEPKLTVPTASRAGWR